MKRELTVRKIISLSFLNDISIKTGVTQGEDHAEGCNHSF